MTRKEYIDISKGILILLVMAYHLPQVGNKLLGLNSEFLEQAENYSFVISSFFMQAFFIITGLCSSFHKPLKVFLVANIRTIILAGILLSLVDNIVGSTLDYSFYYTFDVKALLVKFLNYGTAYWFLTSLFCSKILLYTLLKVGVKPWGILVFSLVLIFIGVLFAGFLQNELHNYWYIHNSCFMFFFLYLGYLLKNKETELYLLELFAPYVYVILMVFACVLSIEIPTITQTIAVKTYLDILLYLVLSISGTFTLIMFSKKIKSNFFVYLGKNTIIIYCTHISVLSTV